LGDFSHLDHRIPQPVRCPHLHRTDPGLEPGPGCIGWDCRLAHKSRLESALACYKVGPFFTFPDCMYGGHPPRPGSGGLGGAAEHLGFNDLPPGAGRALDPEPERCSLPHQHYPAALAKPICGVCHHPFTDFIRQRPAGQFRAVVQPGSWLCRDLADRSPTWSQPQRPVPRGCFFAKPAHGSSSGCQHPE
jgi:hypothetical protein